VLEFNKNWHLSITEPTAEAFTVYAIASAAAAADADDYYYLRQGERSEHWRRL